MHQDVILYCTSLRLTPAGAGARAAAGARRRARARTGAVVTLTSDGATRTIETEARTQAARSCLHHRVTVVLTALEAAAEISDKPTSIALHIVYGTTQHEVQRIATK